MANETINDFHVGDEVRSNISEEPFALIYVDYQRRLICGMGLKGQTFIDGVPFRWHKTGYSYPEMIPLISAIERRSRGEA